MGLIGNCSCPFCKLSYTGNVEIVNSTTMGRSKAEIGISDLPRLLEDASMKPEGEGFRQERVLAAVAAGVGAHERPSRACYANGKTIAGVVEMYNLHYNTSITTKS